MTVWTLHRVPTTNPPGESCALGGVWRAGSHGHERERSAGAGDSSSSSTHMGGVDPLVAAGSKLYRSEQKV